MRSLLYVPGVSEKMILKARDTEADALILDLEDAVSLDRKVEARQTAMRMLGEVDFGAKPVAAKAVRAVKDKAEIEKLPRLAQNYAGS